MIRNQPTEVAKICFVIVTTDKTNTVIMRTPHVKKIKAQLFHNTKIMH